ncbi:MAG: hypothetical protein GXY96_10990 [Tissierellia bacterium]|nr:hypothetical protein [Tissierellia bacterium]
MKDYWAIKLPYRCHYSIYLEDGTYCGETFYDVDINTGVASLDIKLSPAINYLMADGMENIFTQTWSGNGIMINLDKKIGFIEVKR